MESMQFERAEFSSSSALACGNCQAALLGNYYQMNSASVCESCANALKAMIHGEGSKLGRFAKAILLGTGAAIVGGAAYGLISHVTGYNLALVSIGVGIFVGNAVRKGSGGRGGWKYQIMAILLTYLAIGGSLIPDALSMRNEAMNSPEFAELQANAKANPVVAAEETDESAPAAPVRLAEDDAGAVMDDAMGGLSDAPEAIALAFIIAFTLIGGPIVVGIGSPISLLIYAFGIWQAWKANTKLQVDISGPHAIAGVCPPQLPA